MEIGMPAKGATKCKDCAGADCAICHGKGWLLPGECEHFDPADEAAEAVESASTEATATATPSGNPVAPPAESGEEPGWGWWTVYAKQKEWLDVATEAVPFPGPDSIPHADSPLPVLADALQRAGGALAYLNANQGLLKGRAYALKEVFEASMSAAKGRLPHDKTLTTETAREGAVYNDPDVGERLRDTRKRLIEIQTCIHSQDGLIKAYEHVWATISRLMTAQLGEAEMTTNRTN